jgi:hypothetical protein
VLNEGDAGCESILRCKAANSNVHRLTSEKSLGACSDRVEIKLLTGLKLLLLTHEI